MLPDPVPPPAADDRPVVCVDLNGVLDGYTGWRGADHWDPPAPGAEEFLAGLAARGYRIVVLTTRWADDARAWLEAHGLARYVSEVTDRKPAAHVFVDDRAVCFRGDFRATLDEVERFAAHWEAAPGGEGGGSGGTGARNERASRVAAGLLQPAAAVFRMRFNSSASARPAW